MVASEKPVFDVDDPEVDLTESIEANDWLNKEPSSLLVVSKK